MQPASSLHSDLVLANLDWVRGLARALVHDPDDAEDLVQDTWLRVKRSPPSAGRQDRTWLAAVLRNLARDLQRGRSRRVHHEQSAARPDVAESDTELREAVERQESLVQWVLALDQPYRRTMLLRWFAGYDARRIAASESVPLTTVHTRLARGKALLKQRADRANDGEGRAWLAVLAGLPGRPTLAAASTVALIPIAMKFTAVAVSLVAAVLTWFALRGPSDSGPSVAPISVATAAEDERTHRVRVAAPHSIQAERDRSVIETEGLESPVAPVPTTPAEQDSLDLVVRVVDSQGHAVSKMPVSLFHGRGSGLRDWNTVVSDDDKGEAVFDDILSILGTRQWELNGEVCAVGLAIPGLDLQRLPIDVDSPPQDPVTLVAPDTGRVEVRLVDREGRPFPMKTHVFVTSLFPNPDQAGSMRRGERYSVHLDGAASAVFAHVQVGVPLQVETYDEGIVRGVMRRVEGIRRGESRVVDLVLGETLAHVTGRVVDSDGHVPPTRYVDVAFDTGGQDHVEIQADDGRFILPLSRLGDGVKRFEAVIEAKLHEPKLGPHGFRLLSGRFQASVPSRGQSVDVGVVTLHPSPVIASGRVVDSDGAPVEGAFVTIYRKFNQRADPEDFGWNFAGIEYAYTNADGDFVSCGDVEPGEYAIRADAPGFVDRGAVRFEAGARGLELVVDRSRFFRGRVLLPTGCTPTDYQVRALQVDATREERTYATWQAVIQPDGEFVITGLRPDEYTVEVAADRYAAPLATLKRVVPTLTESERLAAMNPWDLRDSLASVDFEVELSNGELASLCLAALGDRQLPVVRGRCKATVERGSDDQVLVVAAGHRPVTLPLDALPKRVQLVRGPKVSLQIASPLPDLPDDWWYEFTLVPESPEWIPAGGILAPGRDYRHEFGSLWWGSIPLQAGQSTWSIHVVGAGNFRGRWEVVRPGETAGAWASRGSFVTRSGRYDIVVDSLVDAPRVWSLDMDPDDVRKVVEGLR